MYNWILRLIRHLYIASIATPEELETWELTLYKDDKDLVVLAVPPLPVAGCWLAASGCSYCSYRSMAAVYVVVKFIVFRNIP